MLGSWYAYAASSDPDALPYDFSFWRAGASVVGTAMTAWFASRRSKATLPVALATAAATIVGGIVNKRKRGSYVTRTWNKDALREKVFNKAMPIVHAAGSVALAGLGIASAVLRKREGEKPFSPLSQAAWYPRLRRLLLYYMGFSLVGHWGEIAFCLGIKHGIFKGGYDRSNHMLWDQWLFPFPAEGIAAVLGDLALMPVKEAVVGTVNSQVETGRLMEKAALPLSIAASFLANQVVCTSIDYATGMVANRNYELWDYRDMRFHFQGQICLQNSLFYSAIATVGVWALLPALEKLFDRAGSKVLDGTLVGLGSFYAMLLLIYHVLPGHADGFDPDALSKAEAVENDPED